MRFRVRGLNSAIWKMKMSEMWLLMISWTMSRVTGTGGAFLAVASARSFSPARASVSTLRTLVSVCLACVFERAWTTDATSQSARTRAHRTGQSSDQKRSSPQLDGDRQRHCDRDIVTETL